MKRKLLFAGLTMFIGLSIVMAVKANSKFTRECCNRNNTLCDEWTTGPYLIDCRK